MAARTVLSVVGVDHGDGNNRHLRSQCHTGKTRATTVETPVRAASALGVEPQQVAATENFEACVE